MEQLKFTTGVLGPLAAYRLDNGSVTQTLRSDNDSIVQAILSGGLKVGDQMQIILDKRMVGLAEYVILDTIRWADVDLSDARRGGFDTMADLERALQRAGYRFMPMDKYKLHRLQFIWLQEA